MHTTENNRARRLLLDAQELGDGWLMAMDHQDMTGQLRALFFGDSFDDLMAARIPMFLGQKLTGQDGKRMTVDQAEDAGLLLSDGDAVPPIRRLRGIRLDALRGLAQWCRADDLVRMIDGVLPAQASLQPAPASSEQDATESGPANQSDKPTVAGDCLPPVTTGDLALSDTKTSTPRAPTTSDIAAAFDDLKWTSEEWKRNLGNKPAWLKVCIAIPGKQGAHETRWNPVLIGGALVNKGFAKPNQVRARFQKEHSPIKAWLEAWKEYEATYFDDI